MTEGPPPPELSQRFEAIRAIAATHAIWLCDWFACDDQLFRSTFTDDFSDRWWDTAEDLG